MPTTTLPTYVAAPDDEDEGFSSGLTRDLRDTMVAAPAVPAAAPVPPVAAPADPAAPPAPAAPAATAPTDDSGNVQAPVYTPPDRTGLNTWESTLQKDQAPINRNDPSVKARWWERLAGGVGAGLMAAGGRGDALDAGRAVVNRRYNEAVQDQQSRIQADQTGVAAQRGIIAGSDQDFEHNMQTFNAQGMADQRNAHAAEYRAQEQQRLASPAPETMQPDDPKNPMGSWHGMTVGGKPVALSAPPDSWLKTPQGKQASDLASRKAMADAAGVKPGDEQYRYIMANGKLHEPVAPAARTTFHMPSAESEKYADRKAAAIRENGGKPLSSAQLALLSKDGDETPKPPPSATPEQIIKLHTDHDAAYQAMEDKYNDLRDRETTDAGRKRVDDARTSEKKVMDAQWGAKFADARPGGWANSIPSTPPDTSTADPVPVVRAPIVAQPSKPNGLQHSLKTAMALPFNKGKTAQQVTSDLKSRGYTVIP